MNSLTPNREMINRLLPEQLEEVVHRSIKQLMLDNRIPFIYLDRRPYPFVGDGGIEIAFSIPDEYPALIPYFENKNTILQCKTTTNILSNSDFIEELSKIDVQTFFEAFDKCSYIVVYSKVKLTKNSQKFETHIQNLRALLQEIYPHLYKKIDLQVWIADDIETLISKTPISWEIFPEKHLLALKANSLKELEKTDSYFRNVGFLGEFVANNEREKFMSQLTNEFLSDSDKVTELRGNMGIGKTRLCYQIIKTLKIEDLCIWLESPDSRVIDFIEQFLVMDSSAKIYLFNDEMKPEELIKISALKRRYPSRFKVLVVTPVRDREPGTSTQNTYILTPMPEDELSLILKGFDLREDVAAKIVKLCKGYPKLAVVIAERIQKANSGLTSDSAIRLLNNDFYDPANPTSGWFNLIMDDQDRKNLGVMSVLMEVGHEKEAIDELKMLSEHFQIPLNELRRTIDKHKRKGLVVDIGNYFYITPLILANQLASMTFKEYKDSLTSLISKITAIDRQTARFNKTPLESLKDRLLSCSDDEAIKDIISDVVKGITGNFIKAAFQDERLLEFVTGMGHVFPVEVLQIFENTLNNLSPHELRTLTEKRRPLVWFLEKAAFYEELFVPAMNCLLVLAKNETETYSNNATGLFVEFFSPVLSGSSANFKFRINYLLQLLSSSESQLSSELVERIFKQVFNFRNMRTTGHENAFKLDYRLKETEKGYSRKELSPVVMELFHYFAKEDNVYSELFLCTFADYLRTIISFGIDIFENEILAILERSKSKKVLKELFKSLGEILEFNYKNMSSEKVERLKSIQQNILNKDFKIRLEIIIDGDRYLFKEKQAEEYFNDLCLEIIKSPELFNLLVSYSETPKVRVDSFMFYLGKLDVDFSLWRLVEHEVLLKKYPFIYYLNGIAIHSKNHAFNFLYSVDKKINDDKFTIKTFATIGDERSKPIVIEKIERLGISTFEDLRFTHFAQSISEIELNHFIDLFPDDSPVLVPFLEGRKKDLDFEALNLRPIIINLLYEKKHGIDIWYVKDNFLPETLGIEKFKSSYLELFEIGLNLITNEDDKLDFNHVEYCNEVLQAIASKFRSETSEIFFNHFSRDDVRPYIATIHFKGWPIEVYEQEFLNLFNIQNFKVCYKFSRFLPNEIGVFTEHAAVLIRRFEKNVEFLSLFSSLLFSTFDVVVGDFSNHYVQLREDLETWGNKYQLKHNKIFKHLEISLEKALNSQLISEREEKYFMNGE